MLANEFEKAGNWLFRWRSYVPLVPAVGLLAALGGFKYPAGSHALDTAWDFVCLSLSLCGLAIRVLAVGFVSRDSSGRNTRGQLADELNTTGMYSLMRHPLYFGNFWIWFGLSLFPRLWWCPVLFSAIYLLIYERIMFAEETFLRTKFGVTFETWSSRTPVFWPRFRSWTPPAHPFSVRAVLRRENSTLLGIVTSYFVLEVVGTRIAEGYFEIDWPWTALFAGTLFLYVVLKILKKLKLLREAGR